MDLQKDYSCLERTTLVAERSVEAENDYQEALPAYCDDIYKVIKCVAKNSVVSAETNYNEVTINIKCHICLTYLNDDNNLCYADFEESFTKNINADNLTDRAFVYAKVNEKYLNYRVINQRRIDIHCAVVMMIKLFDTIKCPCLVNCEHSKLKTNEIMTTDCVNTAVSRIEFDEDFMIPSDSMPIKRIVSFCTNACVTDTKIIKDKVLLKAVVNLAVLYSTDDADEALMKAEYSFNASKIIDISGVEEGDIALTDISVSNIYLKAKLSSGDKMNVISAFGELTADVLFLREKKESLICDGYVLNRQSQCSYSDFSYLTDGKLITDSLTEHIHFDMPNEMTEIRELCLQLSVPQLRGNKITCKASAHIIGLGENGEVIASDGGEDIAYSLDNYDNAYAVFSLNSYDYHVENNGKVEVRCNISVTTYVYHAANCKVLTDIEPSDETVDYPSLTVYFARKNETLWEIAKNFSSDASRIAADNGLNGEVIDSEKIIIIPKV